MDTRTPANPAPATPGAPWKGRPAPGLSGRWKGAHRVPVPAG